MEIEWSDMALAQLGDTGEGEREQKFAYPAKYFYNSRYHLNVDGVTVNTENVRKSIPANCIAAGDPCGVIKQL